MRVKLRRLTALVRVCGDEEFGPKESNDSRMTRHYKSLRLLKAAWWREPASISTGATLRCLTELCVEAARHAMNQANYDCNISSVENLAKSPEHKLCLHYRRDLNLRGQAQYTL